jgi:Asp-tRNA(Asn)/Glu-tRNA(Gln) amidotransferase B subunit
MNQYIIYAPNDKIKKIENAKQFKETKNLKKIIKETELKQYFALIIKVKKTIKCMIYYSTKFINILKHKEKYEASTVVKIDEIHNGIKYISSPYLSRNLLKELIDLLFIEIMYTKDIEKYIYDLEEYNKILPCEFIYKIFLFADYFWNKKIPDKLLVIFYGFTSRTNLYSTEINH